MIEKTSALVDSFVFPYDCRSACTVRHPKNSSVNSNDVARAKD